jgi:hypothetical protein
VKAVDDVRKTVAGVGMPSILEHPTADPAGHCTVECHPESLTWGSQEYVILYVIVCGRRGLFAFLGACVGYDQD